MYCQLKNFNNAEEMHYMKRIEGIIQQARKSSVSST